MNILLALIPISLLLLGLAIAAFAWAVKRGQFDDLDTPALDILADEDDRRAEARAGQAGAGAEAAPAPPAAGADAGPADDGPADDGAAPGGPGGHGG